jgi:hypothetical protein
MANPQQSAFSVQCRVDSPKRVFIPLCHPMIAKAPPTGVDRLREVKPIG